jgi:hypothetical protein
MAEYDRGDTARVEVAITNAAGAPVAPATLTLTVRTPAGVVTTTASFGDPIVTTAEGHYHADIPLPESGAYPYQWETTNPAQVQGGVLTVYPGPLDTGRRAVGDFTPSSADVAALMFSRVAGEYSTTADFTTTTRPTLQQVQGMISLAAEHVGPLVGWSLNYRFHSAARFMVTLYSALLLEPGYWPEQSPDKSTWEQWKQLYDDGLPTLLLAIKEYGAGEEVGPDDDRLKPIWAFPATPIRVEW